MSTPALPTRIRKLEENVINRIAAGEIILRPANALKELLENSFDAGATQIKVTVKEGGIKGLVIQDNGCGINKEDLPILCERFTTSKIRDFEDLSSLSTFGFRGEALASISHVANFSVTTKTKDSECAWTATYTDGKMKSLNPAAGNDGTLMVIEDLFYNIPSRLKTLKSASEEYSQILSMVTKYAVHKTNLAISVKKANASPDLATSISWTKQQAIGNIYGANLGKELLSIEAQDDGLGLKSANGWISSANFAAKKATWLWFVNDRLVSSTIFQRAFAAFYSSILPKGSHPFVYLSLQIDPEKVDVNVHPTKKEVRFLDEEEIVEVVLKAVEEAFEKSKSSRGFKVQTLLQPKERPAEPWTPKASTSTFGKAAPNKQVRTSPTTQTLDGIYRPLARTNANSPSAAAQIFGAPSTSSTPRPTKRRRLSPADENMETRDSDMDIREEEGEGAARYEIMSLKISESKCNLTSVKVLRDAVSEGEEPELTTIIRNHTFVGIVDLTDGTALLQHGKKLYLLRYFRFAEELFYQLGLRQFGTFGRLKLQPAPSVASLLELAIRAQKGPIEKAGLTTEQVLRETTQILGSEQRRGMLHEYFSLEIDNEGNILSLPILLPGYTPNLDKLPLFLLRIAAEVEWYDEELCFTGFLRELSFLYSPTPLFSSRSDASTSQKEEDPPWEIEHLLFKALKMYFVAPKTLRELDLLVELTSLESLYKTFERC
ncbi:MutL 1 [Atractiella rhizophila]|nr:MutL 1 [Atractiella rhizophila]